MNRLFSANARAPKGNQGSSLRWRLAWSFTLLSTCAVLIQAIALFVSTEEQEEDMINELVNAALDDYLHRSGPAGDALSWSLPAARFQLHRSPQGVAPAPLPPRFASLPVGNHEWYVGETEYHIGIREQQGDRLYLMYDVGDHERRLDQLRVKLLVGIAVLSLISLWLGYWLAGHLLFQLQKITEHLQRDEQTALNTPDLDREVGLLAKALDDYRQRNRELLAREQEFTANVSHELRTPLTRLRTSAELLADDPALAGRASERANRIVAAADDIENRLRGLLFLARELALETCQPLHLRSHAEASAAHFRAACEAADIDLQLAIDEHVLINADGALLRLLLDNLIGNAVRHTRHGRIVVGYGDATLTIADTGSGIAAEHLAHVFERHYRGSNTPGGQGLGLSIVKRICDAHGWRCSIDSIAAPGDLQRGTRVAVRFNHSAEIATETAIP